MSDFVMDELSKAYTNVEYSPVDISSYESGNTGIPYVWSYDSRSAGPHVMICGIMHGNEIAGAAILDSIMKQGVRPKSGKLTLCFGNPEAYLKFDPEKPYRNRFIDADINRVWGAELTDESNHAGEVCRARELRSLVDTVDYLLDIHTMQGRGAPVAITKDKPAGLKLIAHMTSIPFVLVGEMHQANRLRLRDYGQFGDPSSASVAIQVEAGQHWETSSLEVGETIALEFLECVGVIDPTERTKGTPQKRLEIVEIIMPEGGLFEYAEDFVNGTHFPERGALLGFAGKDRREVRTPVDNCFFIMPVHFRQAGGSCGRFAREIAT